MRYISVCSGIEAASVAWAPLGWTPVAFSEIEPFPKTVLKHHYPNVPDLGDMTKVDWNEWFHTADVVVGGTPCQAFSVAGLRQGLDDPRGQLMLEFFRACKQIDPEWVIWENVPGVLSQDGGRAFGSLLEAVAYLWPDGGCAWRVLDAQFFGVAQRRRRVFVVVNTRDWRRAAPVLLERESVQGTATSSREKRQTLTSRLTGSVDPADRPLGNGTVTMCRADTQTNAATYVEACPTLSAHSRKDPPPHLERTVVTTSNGQDVFPALCASDGQKMFINNQAARGGKLIVERTGG